jgi:hypothetical protein
MNTRLAKAGLMKGAVCLVALAFVALAAGRLPTANAGSAFIVRSSLDGRTVLPHRIHWLGLPTLRRSEVSEVAFLIDGRVRWIEHGAPYSFGDDGGYLVTSWLSPGPHHFTVRVRSTDGQTTADTVTARVLPAPTPPASLAGRWQRQVRDAVHDPTGGAIAPAGTWTLNFERRWIEDIAPGKWNPKTSNKTGLGGIVDNDWIPGTTTFQIGAGIQTRILHDENARGGWWCEPSGPFATYAWTVRDNTLTLKPTSGTDPCFQRGAIYTGQWTRVR